MDKGWLRRLVTIGALALSLSMAACIVRPGPGGGDTNNGGGGGGGGDAAIVIRNNSGSTICFVNFSATSSSDWGGDQLGSNETIGPGESRSFSVNAGGYDVRMQDCEHNTLAERRGVSVSGSTDVSLD